MFSWMRTAPSNFVTTDSPVPLLASSQLRWSSRRRSRSRIQRMMKSIAHLPVACLKLEGSNYRSCNNNPLLCKFKCKKNKQRPRKKIFATDWSRPRMQGETWSVSLLGTSLQDGIVPLRLFSLRKIMVQVSMCGQLVAFSLNFWAWWKKMHQHLWIANHYSLERVASPFRRLRTLLSSVKDSLSATKTSLQSFLQFWEPRVSLISPLSLIRKRSSIWKLSHTCQRSTWSQNTLGQALKLSISWTVFWCSIPTTESVWRSASSILCSPKCVTSKRKSCQHRLLLLTSRKMNWIVINWDSWSCTSAVSIASSEYVQVSLSFSVFG